jgi:AraC-like DNA-binding protein
MMLRYVGLGKRQLGDHPMPPHARLNWEFLAVVRGKVSPFESQPKNSKLLEKHCWLFPPGVVHGWVGEKKETCEVIVLHFSSLPHPIEQVATNRRMLETRLTRADLKALSDIVPGLERHYWSPTVVSELHAQRALIDICLLMIRDYAERSSPQMSGGSYSRVVKAEEWLRANLETSPAVKDAARHVGLSTSRLCRLFFQVRKETPQEYLNRIKLDRAMELLAHTNAKLEKIAAECGFSNASNLCRAFKAAKGISPTQWRMETYIQYRPPPKGEDADHEKHGERVRPVL